MRYGVCLGIDKPNQIESAAKAGFDFVEGNFQTLVNFSQSEFEKFENALIKHNIPCEALNCFLPGEIKVTGYDVDYDRIKSYIDAGFMRAGKLGVKTVVFGSSRSRNIPEGFSREKGISQLVFFLKDIVSPAAASYGITVVTEPLRKKESNIINSVKDAAALADMTGCDNISSLVDLFHALREGDTYGDIKALSGRIIHAHISRPKKKFGQERIFPSSADEFDYKGFVDALTFAGCERCSIEASSFIFSREAAAAIKVLRSL